MIGGGYQANRNGADINGAKYEMGKYMWNLIDSWNSEIRFHAIGRKMHIEEEINIRNILHSRQRMFS